MNFAAPIADSRPEALLGVQRLVAQLHDLRAGPEAAPRIIALGAAAVPALEAFLRGPSQALHQHRVLAADCLAAIGGPEALAALLRALQDCSSRELAPVPLQAEDVVVASIAEHLAHHATDAVVQGLLDALARRTYPACARALGTIGDPRALESLAQCLYEDPARASALAALRRFGYRAAPLLRTVLIVPRRVHGAEPPVCVAARAAAASLLAELGEREALLCALDDREADVRFAAAIGLLEAGAHDAPPAAIGIAADALDDTSPAHAWAAIHALSLAGRSLGSVGGPVGEQIVKRLSSHPSHTSHSSHMPDGRGNEWEHRRLRHAASLAGKLALTDAITPLVGLSCSLDRFVRLAALRALIRIPAARPSDLAPFLSDHDLSIARRAARAMAALDAATVNPTHLSAWLRRPRLQQRHWRRWWRWWRILRLYPITSKSRHRDAAGRPLARGGPVGPV